MAAEELSSVALIERDRNGDSFWVWCFPSVSVELRQLLLRKCRLQEAELPLYNFLYGQHRRTWYYITPTRVEAGSALDKVTHFCLVLTARDFHPEKYAALGRILSRLYEEAGSPVPVVETFLSVVTKGTCQSQDNGTFLSRHHDQRQAFMAGSIKDVVLQFGMESVILYSALMLKKRIVVYHPKVEAVLEFSRSLPALVWHRQDWSILHPYVHLIPEEVDALKSTSGYIAGFQEAEVGNRSDLYDVFVNLAENSVSISPGAKEALTLGKLHKEVGQLMVQSAEDPDKSESQVIKDICVKSGEILSILSSLSQETGERDKPTVNLEQLRQKKFPPATENFLMHLAAAEQMLLT
ncbi:PREDICTED: protein FAM45A [Nanorana parkeri]|uniref:protein FAM45A n=1 Tax=Nanorana parkeri TaxID=125878 RepID=UPI000854E983|nr:PREDICTED: protein FAM45A [Nanorana parkeri]